LRGAEWDGGFAPALRTNRRSFDPARRTPSFGSAVLPFRLAVFAALRLISELFVVIELLFACGENKIRTTVDAFENPILKFGHGTILEWEGEADAILFAC
jgi:hypothetical protein